MKKAHYIIISVICLFILETTTAANAAPATSTVASKVALGDPQAKYDSLSTALLEFYANNQEQAFGDFLASNGDVTENLLGADSALKGLSSTTTREQLNSKLATSPTNASSLAEWKANLELGAPNSLDTKVVVQSERMASNYADQLQKMGSMRSPSVSTPKADAPKDEANAYAYFVNRTITAMAVDHPEQFQEVLKNGVASPEAESAWNESMKAAVQSTDRDLTSGLINSCQAALMSNMVGGSIPTPAGCESCAVAGKYLSGKAKLVMDPSTANLFGNAEDGTLSQSEWDQLPKNIQEKILKQNPQWREALTAKKTQEVEKNRALAQCQEASAASQSALSQALPEITAKLNDR